MDEKKERLFKWNNYQRIKLSNAYVKSQLLSIINTLRLISLFETFTKAIYIWGSNEAYQLGLQVRKDFVHFYNHQINDPTAKEQYLQEITNLTQNKENQQELDVKLLL